MVNTVYGQYGRITRPEGPRTAFPKASGQKLHTPGPRAVRSAKSTLQVIVLSAGPAGTDSKERPHLVTEEGARRRKRLVRRHWDRRRSCCLGGPSIPTGHDIHTWPHTWFHVKRTCVIRRPANPQLAAPVSSGAALIVGVSRETDAVPRCGRTARNEGRVTTPVDG